MPELPEVESTRRHLEPVLGITFITVGLMSLGFMALGGIDL